MAITYSIGGYHISKVKTFQGRDFQGYKLVLNKDGKEIVEVIDHGDGSGAEIDFLVDDQGIKDQVLADLKKLYAQFGNRMHPNALPNYYFNTPYSAAEGWGDLLKQFKAWASFIDKEAKKYSADTFYLIGIQGTSPFADISGGFVDDLIHICPTETQDVFKAEEMFAKFKSQLNAKKASGEVYAGAYLRGKMDWNLSMSDYGELLTP